MDAGLYLKRNTRILHIADADKGLSPASFLATKVIMGFVISAIDAVRLARKAGAPNPNRMTVGVAGIPHGGMMVTISKSF